VLYVRYHQQKPGKDKTAEEPDEFEPVLMLPEKSFLQRNPISVSWTAGGRHHRKFGRILLDLGF
jgi:hypothetical protein